MTMPTMGATHRAPRTRSQTQTPELLRPRTTHRHPTPVDKLGLEVPACVALERSDVIKVHDVRAVDACETSGVESLYEPIQREVQRVARTLGVGDYIVALCLKR